MHKKQAGFTLIELVVVIVIIGILAAAALPRFINLQVQARAAKANAIFGSIKSAAALAKANCLVDLAGLTTPSTCTVVAGTTNMDGAAVDMINQYPAPTANGILRAAQISLNDIVPPPAGDPMVIDIPGGNAPNCRITYPSAVAGSAPVPLIDVTNC